MTAAVLLTPAGVGAIAVVRVAGPGAREVVARLATSGRVAGLLPGQTARTDLGHKGDLLDDALAVCVGADAVELHVHGGVAVTDAVLRALAELGAARLDLEEARAGGIFGRGVAADVMLALPRAVTLSGARLVAAQVEGGISGWAREWLGALGSRNLWQFQSAAQWVVARSEMLAHLLAPPRVALVGAPNAGKSTLANALLGRPVAITSDLPGTTRDWVDAATTFVHGDVQVPVMLVDTAGIRETADPLERESIARTHGQARRAELVVLVVDASNPAELSRVMDRAGGRRETPCDLVALNKCDLLEGPPRVDFGVPAVPISAKCGNRLSELMTAVLEQLDLVQIMAGEPFAFCGRLRKLLAAMALCGDVDAGKALLHTLLEE
jgi:tRNA modification GTPase